MEKAGRFTVPNVLQRVARMADASERAAVGFTAKHSVTLLRVALAIVFIWFGALKVTGASPVEDLVAQVVFWVPKAAALQVLGWTEIFVGVALLLRFAPRLAMALFFVHMPGTFLILVLHPELAFQHNNPLLLTTIGEFVLKNIVLLAAGTILLGTLRAPRTPRETATTTATYVDSAAE
jgi:uncharacterized membrane protein YkgB